MKPDYRKYTKRELEDVLENIDSIKYPDRHREIVEVINQKEYRKTSLYKDDVFKEFEKKFKDNHISIYVISFIGFLFMLILEYS
jgi:predicted glycosyltransferase